VDQDDPQKIAAFVEKPATTPGLAADPTQFLASMGNYVFDADALVDALHVDAERLDTKHDMGGDIIPYFVNKGEAGVYDFTLNDIPGSTERDRTYWRDVGTIDSFYDAHMDLISPLPVFNLYNSEWPIYTRQTISPPAKFVRGERDTVGMALDSIVANGVVVSGGVVEGSVLSNDVFVGNGSRIIDSVLMDKVNIGEGAVVNRAILDKNVKVPAGAAIGLDHDLDRARGFKVTESGITVLAKGQQVPEPGDEERALAARNLHLVPDAVKAATANYAEIRESVEQAAAAHAQSASQAVSSGRHG
jgi:glucose-1-phosphate adenylyltransferase